MEIKYELKSLSGYLNVEVDFCFNNGSHLLPKLMLVAVDETEFEDAVLELAKTIEKKRGATNDIGTGLLFYQREKHYESVIFKLIDVIKDLVNK